MTMRPPEKLDAQGARDFFVAIVERNKIEACSKNQSRNALKRRQQTWSPGQERS